jgi:GT2 family glycosyltransferase
VAPDRLKVGLVVLNWNGAAVLPLCLETLETAAAVSRHDVGLLLVDNDSRDGSDLWAEREHPAWELLRTGSNLRYAKGMNAGIRAWLDRGADYILLLNNDIRADAEFIDPLIEDLETGTPRGAACPRIHYMGLPQQIWYGGGRVSRYFRITAHRGIRKHALGSLRESGVTDYLTGCALMGKAAFWKETGGFDKNFEFYAEDVDLSLRAREAGWSLRYVPSSLIYHRVGHSSGGGLSESKLRAQWKGTRKLIGRHVHPALRPMAWLAWALHVGITALKASLRGERGLSASMARALSKKGKSP